MFDLTPWHWVLLGIGSILIGVSKTGIPGLGVLTVAIYANVFPALQSTGIILPLLICADIGAVLSYRQHCAWRYLLKLSPWIALGMAMGYLVMKHIHSDQIEKVIGGIVLVMVILHFWRRSRLQRGEDDLAASLPHSLWFIALTGILSGLATMIANAAGSVMILYALAVGLPKLEFLGTLGWCFFILNLIKVPLSYSLHLISPPTLAFDLKMIPLVIAGSWLGQYIAKRIYQNLFELLALGFTLFAALRLVLRTH
jgi:hypothetical protein